MGNLFVEFEYQERLNFQGHIILPKEKWDEIEIFLKNHNPVEFGDDIDEEVEIYRLFIEPDNDLEFVDGAEVLRYFHITPISDKEQKVLLKFMPDLNAPWGIGHMVEILDQIESDMKWSKEDNQ
jgi:hypothetical protein